MSWARKMNTQMYDSDNTVPTIDCSSISDSICYLLTIKENNDPTIVKLDFNNPEDTKQVNPFDANKMISNVVAFTDDIAIVGGFDVSSSPHKHLFYIYNHTSHSVLSSSEVNALGKYFWNKEI